MTALNALLFELMRASPRHATPAVVAAQLLVVLAAPLTLAVAAVAWLRAGPRTRAELALALGSALLAALPLLPAGSALDGDVLLLWALSLGLLPGRRLAWLAFPGLALGLATGWAKVYLGLALPLAVAAALPVAVLASWLAWRLCLRLAPGRYHGLRRAMVRLSWRSRRR
ncbi:hypothetical protein GT347_21635 [Xylophilus rhododendri]|uniref:Uncharacterized protein n=1 Tax=Xylophilus rhododendri TaxID=2697032 RepID=A0A857J8I0_9BURK|nr:hypothetical protein [Xylophilus rhododendri]QHJ00351.1 hypothetical protein GT347_21635 [Xylophilus rhododendri]